jgi:nucleoside-diphosphate-sugar epimerase
LKYLVTGGAGFIGSHLVEELTSRGESVRVVDNFLTGRRENLAPFLKSLELIEGDLADPRVAERAVAGVDCVLHQAALPSVPRSVADPLGCHHNCVTATVALLEAARRAGVRRVVLASSSSVYGDQPELPKRESQQPAPRSPYAAAKLCSELYAAVYSRLHGLSTVCLRYFNVFGPRQDPKSQYAAVVPAFITAVLEGRPPTIYGDGRQSRDFTFVGNVVQANLLAARSERALAGEAVNVACGRSCSLLALLDGIARELGKSVAPRFAPPQPGDVRESLADISRAGELLGYQPQIAFAQGLAITVRSYAAKR